MSGEVFRLYREGGGVEALGKELPPDHEQRLRALEANYRILPTGEDIDEAAGMMLANRERIEARFGVTAWRAFVTLSDRSFRDRMPIVPLTQRFIRTLEEAP